MISCSLCGAWVVWPQPSPGDVEAHYRHNSAGLPTEVRDSRNGTTQARSYEFVAARVAAAARRAALPRVSRMVDVGAGDLELSESLVRAFPEAHLEAWDFFADRSRLEPRDAFGGRIAMRRVDLNRLEDWPGDLQRFDIVVCFAVLEHVLDPGKLLRCLRSMTNPGGLVYVVAPEVDSIAHRLLRRRWPYYCPEEHLTLPSLRSIRSAVAIAGGGECELRRINIHYSLRYLLRFFHVPVPIPKRLDVLLPLPVGAFELIWRVSEDACARTEQRSA